MRSTLWVILYIGVAAAIAVSTYLSFVYIDKSKAELERIEVQLGSLGAELERLQQARDHLVSGPILDLIVPRTFVVKLADNIDQDNQKIYHFVSWLDVPDNRKTEIRRVDYRYQDGGSTGELVSSSEPSNGFAVSHLGAGCFSQVDVLIFQTSGTISEISFDQCQQIGWRQ